MFLSFARSENMDWGPQADLVEEANKIQGRENNKRMVVMKGENINLECKVTFTSSPANLIIWKIDGQTQKDNVVPQVNETMNGDVHIKGNLTINDISQDKDGKTVSCEYSKGIYGESILAVLRVFTLEIKTSGDACDTCTGDVTLVFKESERKSPAESTVDERIKAKIKEITNTKIKVDEFGYKVTIPANAALKDISLLKMKPTFTKDGATISQCLCDSVKVAGNTSLIAGIAVPLVLILLACVTVGVIWKKKKLCFKG